ncbi:MULTISPECIES: SpoIIE family protein phosphatase [unclassified Streptomyces]|uniref:SpoIIE family protein phosphatase n=1 Tax=unclassified Streptomyces TaxID=2593676 RepID=UPI0009A0A99B|nr:SpoIIE family protein phosphatase [Streptomyces sp. TSRI0107]
MGAIPTQRESPTHPETDPVDVHLIVPPCAHARTTLTAGPLAPGAARRLLRTALREWADLGLPGAERTGEDAAVVVSELVTNAVVHAGTDVELSCRLEPETGALVVEVSDRNPARAPRDGAAEPAHGTPEYGRGLRLVAALCESWGVTYRRGAKTVWARLTGDDHPDHQDTGDALGVAGLLAPEPRRAERDREWLGRGALSFLAEASDLLAGQLDEDLVAALTGQLLVPRLADWCAIWLEDEAMGRGRWSDGGTGAPGPRLARVWHTAEDRMEELRRALEKEPPRTPEEPDGGPVAYPWPAEALGDTAWQAPRAYGTETGPGSALGAGPAPGTASDTAPAFRPAAAPGTALAPGTAANTAPAFGPVAAPGAAPAPGTAAGTAPAFGPVAAPDAAPAPGTASGTAPAPDVAPGTAPAFWPVTTLGTVPAPDAAPGTAPAPGTVPASRPAAAPGAAPVPDVVPGAAPAFRPGTAPTPGTAAGATPGTALAFRLVAGGRPLGTLVIGRAGVAALPGEITGLVEDLSRRVALAIGAARQYARQATISAVLQRGLLPGAVAEIPGLRSALVHEPCDVGGPSGDFYDLFPAGDGRWCFAIGDVQGKGPEAAVVIGLARPWLRLLAREGYRVADVLDRLNQLLLDDATEAADAAARALAGPVVPGDGPQTRFLSLLYGELVPFDGGVRCTLASAGHPLPLLLGPDGDVRTVARPQTLLGVVEDETYTSDTFELLPGDTLLCVTDGVTERRSGSRQFDDGDGLAAALAGCAGLSADDIAERIRRLVHEFGGRPPEDDLALLVLQAEQAEQAEQAGPAGQPA